MMCPRCLQDNPSHATFCLACGVLLRSTSENGPPGAPYAELQRALTEALEQQTATAEILRVISSSPDDIQPVFEVITTNALRLCAASGSGVYLFDGEWIHVAALRDIDPVGTDAVRHAYPIPPSRSGATPRAILTREAVYIRDVLKDPEYKLASTAAAVGYRSIMSVPMLHEGQAIGAITVNAADVAAFSENHMELLQTFADQAVIAIENVRLFKELETRNRDLTEALERQTATSNVLQIISSSPTNVQPVFDAIIRSAVTLCDATFGGLHLFDGEQITLDAHSGLPEEELEVLRTVFPFPMRSNSLIGRAMQDRSPVQIEDVRLMPGYHSPAIQSLARYRTGLAVPMLREGAPIGGLALWRSEVRPFTDRQIELMVTFASQAVIAIENVRLFTELQEKNAALTQAHAQVTETLEQQTATSEILRVISTSPTDAQPVFDTIIQNAVRLLGGFSGVVTRLVGSQLHLGALTSTNPSGDAAQKTLWPKPVREDRSLHGQVISALGPRFVADVESDPSVPPEEVVVARARGYRSIVAVPLVRDARAVGSIAVTRRAAGPFSDSEIALLQTFADQAVIAIENVRLFTELQEKNRALTQAHAQVTESLERQTATSDILRVISSAHTDAQPVFDTIVRSAVRLCKATGAAVFLTDGRMLYEPAHYGGSPEVLAASRARYPRPLDADTTAGIAVLTRSVIHIPDTEGPSATEWMRQSGRLIGFRSVVTVPMLRDGDAVGAILVTRRQPGPFSDTEVALLKTSLIKQSSPSRTCGCSRRWRRGTAS